MSGRALRRDGLRNGSEGRAVSFILRIFFSFPLFLSFSSADASPASTAPAGRPMSLDDLLTAVRVADPQISPDGRYVAFVRTTTDLAGGRRYMNVWLVPVDGSAAPRPLTRNEKKDDAPSFSPDASASSASRAS